MAPQFSFILKLNYGISLIGGQVGFYSPSGAYIRLRYLPGLNYINIIKNDESFC
jgi:hypothetical protein